MENILKLKFGQDFEVYFNFSSFSLDKDEVSDLGCN